MSYLKTVYVPDGSGEPGCYAPYHIYKCDVTGEEIEEAAPHLVIKGLHISNSGVLKLLEMAIKNGGHGGILPYAIMEVLDSVEKRRKPNRYIRNDIRELVLNKYEHTCIKCGSTENLTIDHIVPVIKGGKNDFPNLQVLCKRCNSSKGKKANEHFMSK